MKTPLLAPFKILFEGFWQGATATTDHSLRADHTWGALVTHQWHVDATVAASEAASRACACMLLDAADAVAAHQE